MSNKSITININILDTEHFKKFLEIMSKALWDERIPEEVRNEYHIKLAEVFGGEKNWRRVNRKI